MFDDISVRLDEYIVNPLKHKVRAAFSRIQSYRKKMGWKFWAVLAGVGFILFIVFVLFTYITYANDLATPESLMNRNNTGLIIFDRNGTTIYRAEGAHTATFTPISDISPYVKEATIAIEDKDFYKHPGFSARSILLAIYADIQLGAARYGASTLTQQLVKNALLSPEKSLKRKLQELILSIEIERRYSKDQILEMYVNSSYYGGGAYGVTNAAQIYFNKKPANLTLAESAALAAIINAPSQLSPFGGDLELLTKRQHLVLQRMVEQGDITEAQMNEAIADKLVFAPPPKESFGGDAAHFSLWLKDYLYQKYGEDAVSRLGFRVTSTLDYSLQTTAVKILQNQVKALASQKVTNGALVSINPKTGEVLAMIGSVDYDNEQFGKVNVVFAKRQPGSSFKPIVYTEAFKQGFTAATILHDVPTDFGGYKPLDYDRKFRGDVTIRRSLANSLNIPAVELLQKVGIDNALALAQNMGISTLSTTRNYGLSLVLGGGEVRLFELTRAYGVLADGGKLVPTHPILKIEDKLGNKIYTYDPAINTEETNNGFSLTNLFNFGQNSSSDTNGISGIEGTEIKNVIDDKYAYITSSILSDDRARSEAFGSGSALLISRTAAVKTGTTDSYRDSWTVGYTPSFVTGVWIGNNDNSPMLSVAGSIGAAPIWHQVMEAYLKGKAVEEFTMPSTVKKLEVCQDQAVYGLLASCNVCQQKFTEVFVDDNSPEKQCTQTITPTPGATSTPVPTDSPTPAPTSTPVPASATPQPTATSVPASPTPVITITVPLSSPTPTP